MSLELLEKANARLKLGKISARIIVRGDRLYIRATFPPKPGSKYTQDHQQDLALGYRLNVIGVKEAEKEARKIGVQLDLGHFNWSEYLKPDQKNVITVQDWVAKLEFDYFSRRERTPATETTWKGEYLKIYKRLPSDRPLSNDLLLKTILSTKPDTRTRRRAVLACNKLAEFAGLGTNFNEWIGSYSLGSVQPRDIPSDQQIAKTWESLPKSSPWRWVFGMLACYGLRGHEIFHLDFSNFPQLRITEGKTGGRICYPFYPEWVEQWHLSDVNLPDCSGRNNSDLGNRVTHAFKRLGIGFSPYDLRHAWAIRSLEYGLDLSLAAKQMGHSLQVHSHIYHHWITEKHHQRAFENLKARINRPLPPSF